MANIGVRSQYLITAGLGLGFTGSAAFAPMLFFWLLAACGAAALLCLAYRYTLVFIVLWLLLTGATLEMTLGDLLGPAWYQPTIAVVKAVQIGLAVICILRFGAIFDLCNPSLAFVAMFVAGMAHGRHPELSVGDSLRSAAGSIAPFAFSFCRLPGRWAHTIIRTTCWIPILSLAACAVLDVAGLRPLFYEGGGARLGGLGHPAFLAGFCLAAIYAALIELYRQGRPVFLALLAANFVILLLTGARAPLAYAAAVTGLTFLFVQSPAFPRRSRILPLLLAACLLPMLVLLASDLEGVRLFNVLANEAGNLSGRTMLWPSFEAAAETSPWFGWGVGAGNVIIAPDSQLARLMQTWAAHNEYLRILVEGGQLGRGLLIVLFAIWVMRHTASLQRTDRIIMRLVFAAFAAHAFTDNILIATTACVFFTFVSAVFACSTVATHGPGSRMVPTARLMDAEQVA